MTGKVTELGCASPADRARPGTPGIRKRKTGNGNGISVFRFLFFVRLSDATVPRFNLLAEPVLNSRVRVFLSREQGRE